MANQWDASTISAVVALVVSLFALLVTSAQALQQYFITGQLIRLCDSVVFGPLPGQGRRIWQLSQFRFRVVYSIPQISLRADLWPEESPHIKSYAVGEEPLPDLDEVPVTKDVSRNIPTFSSSTAGVAAIRRRFRRSSDYEVHVVDMTNCAPIDPSKPRPIPGRLHRQLSRYWYSTSFWLGSRLNEIRGRMLGPAKLRKATPSIEGSVGEASWVSFCKAINGPCGASVRYDSVTYDADRCPSDLVTAPMQVSMRDIAVMGLMTGMRITSCSFKDKSVSMQGAVGSITSSNHPILGPILHFTPRAFTSAIPRSVPLSYGDVRGVVSERWLARTWDTCTVAKRFFNSLTRRTTRRLDDRWAGRQNPKRRPRYSRDDSYDTDEYRYRFRPTREVKMQLPEERFEPEYERPVPRTSSSTRRSSRDRPDDKADTKASTSQSRGTLITRRPNDGPWTIILPAPPARLEMKRESRGEAEVQAAKVQVKAKEAKEAQPPPPQPSDPAVDSALAGKKAGKEVPGSSVPGIVTDMPLEHTQELQPENTSDFVREDAKEPGENLYDQPPPVQVTAFHTEGQISESLSPPEGAEVQQPGNEPASVTMETIDGKAPPVTEAGIGSTPFSSQRPSTTLLLTQAPHWEETTAESHRDSTSQKREKGEPRRQATVEDEYESTETEGDSHREESKKRTPAARSESPESQDTSMNDRSYAAKVRQAARNERIREIQRDKVIVEESEWERRHDRHNFLLEYPEDGPSSSPRRRASKTEEELAREREIERQRKRDERERERDRRNNSRGRTVALQQMDLYWFCQVDVYQGFWATPWESNTPHLTSLVGSVTVILEALLGFLEENASLVYCNPRHFEMTREWISRGNISYPAYAHNARGGVISQGLYKGVHVSAFQTPIPALELLISYDWQVSMDLHNQETYCESLNVELMRIDSWLSYVGRTYEISHGPKQLLKEAPGYVQLLREEFELDFMNIDLSAKEGGYQDIKGLTENVMDFLTDEELNEAEQLYILVALLRATKVCQFVQAGSNTTEMHEILLKDVQIHLV